MILITVENAFLLVMYSYAAFPIETTELSKSNGRNYKTCGKWSQL